MSRNRRDVYTSAVNESFDELPAFLQKRLTNWYVNRYQQRWGGRHLFHSLAASPDAVMLQSNDYLGLNGHPEIVQAGQMALAQQHAGMVMSGVFLQPDALQYQFEQAMADFMQAEDALVCQSGWCANTGLLQAIADENTPVYVDMLAHMSLWEGVHSAGAQVIPFRHNDIVHLQKQIQKFGRGIIVVDSVYSTTGSVCPLKEMANIAEQYQCLFVVDESHSLGTHGHDGSGLVTALGIADKVHFRTASLAKAFAGRAGIITGKTAYIEYIRYASKPTIFSSALLPHEIAQLMKTLEIIEQSQLSRVMLAQKAEFFRGQLSALGYNVSDSQSQIVSLEAGPESATLKLRDALESRGIFGAVFCEPATAKNRSLIRFTLSCNTPMKQLEQVIAVCAAIRQEVGMANWPSTQRLMRDRQRQKMLAKGRKVSMPDWQALAGSDDDFDRAA